jgi:hypothetical protein
MKIGKQKIEKDDFSAYAETMRGLPTADNQELFDKEINEALDQLGRVYDFIGNTPNKSSGLNKRNSSNSLSIADAAKMK